MASAGAQCDHISHVSTQLPYALTVAAISLVTYLLCGLFCVTGVPAIIALPIGLVLTFAVLFTIKKVQK